MAGGRELAMHAKRPQEAMKREIDSTGRERGARGFSPRGKMGRRRLGDGGSRGEAGGGTGDPRRGGYLGHGRREREKGTVGRAGKGSTPFCRGRALGRTHPRCEVERRLRLDPLDRARGEREVGGGSDGRGRDGSGWARGGGAAAVAAELGRRAAGPREAMPARVGRPRRKREEGEKGMSSGPTGLG